MEVLKLSIYIYVEIKKLYIYKYAVYVVVYY